MNHTLLKKFPTHESRYEELLSIDKYASEIFNKISAKKNNNTYNVWFDIANYLNENTSNCKYKYGRMRFTLDKYNIDPGCLYTSDDHFLKVYKARAYLIKKLVHM
jgi:hypothetical protein